MRASRTPIRWHRFPSPPPTARLVLFRWLVSSAIAAPAARWLRSPDRHSILFKGFKGRVMFTRPFSRLDLNAKGPPHPVPGPRPIPRAKGLPTRHPQGQRPAAYRPQGQRPAAYRPQGQRPVDIPAWGIAPGPRPHESPRAEGPSQSRARTPALDAHISTNRPGSIGPGAIGPIGPMERAFSPHDLTMDRIPGRCVEAG